MICSFLRKLGTMNNRQRKYIFYLAQVLFWLITGAAIISTFSIISHEIEQIDGVRTVRILRSSSLKWQLLIMVGLAAIISYMNYPIILNISNVDQKWKSVIKSALLFFLGILIYQILSWMRIIPMSMGPQIGLASGILGFYFISVSAFGLTQLWIQSEKEKMNIVAEKQSMELELLKTRLHPHFLFNALNNIMNLVDQSTNPRVAKAIDQLSQLLRFVIADTEEEKILFTKEVDFIQNLCKLYGMRYAKNELQVNLKVDGSFTDQSITPGIFIPFVENALKHGAIPDQQSQVSIHFDCTQSDRIRFQCVNPRHKNISFTHHTGTGLKDVRKRLEILYPNKFDLDIKADDLFEVTLEIFTS